MCSLSQILVNISVWWGSKSVFLNDLIVTLCFTDEMNQSFADLRVQVFHNVLFLGFREVLEERVVRFWQVMYLLSIFADKMFSVMHLVCWFFLGLHL